MTGDVSGTGRPPDGLPSLVRLIADRARAPGDHKVKICLFLGAGADLSSGGLSFADLKRQAIEEFSRRPLFDITLPEQIEARFESLFIGLPPDDRALLVEALFRRLGPLQPSDGYKLLVLLAEAGGVDAVVTTNFDLMLERAQSQLGRDVFQVFAPGFARPYLVSHARYELPKKPYLKLHGDLASRSVMLLTSSELEGPQYDRSMLELLESIVRTHDLVFCGYSGADAGLARLMAEEISHESHRIFWCSPSPPREDSPLYSRLAHRIIRVRTTFDALMMEVSRPVLERPTLAATEPTYLRCLFDWRLDYCNQEYINSYGQRAGRPALGLLARRPLIENRLAAFARSNRPLAIVAGPSGFGKTTLGIRLHKTWRADSAMRLLLVKSRALADNGDIEQYVVEQIGGLGSRSPLTLFRLEAWLRENHLRLVLFIDGINEFSPDLSRCVHFLRGIVRLCYFLPEFGSGLRVIATVRQESWNAMLPHIDSAQLQKTLWVEGESEHATNTITCGRFEDDELRDALDRLRANGYAPIDMERLSPGLVDRLRDPYLLAVVSQATTRGLLPVPGATMYQEAFEARLQRHDSLIDRPTLKATLSAVALRVLASKLERFRSIDIEPAALRSDVLRVVKDLGLVIDAGDGFLQFDHDRTLEYFLAHAFSTGSGPSLETLDDLRRFVTDFRTQSKPIAAARLHFQTNPRERFVVIAEALRTLDAAPHERARLDDEPLFEFANEVLVEMIEQGDPLAEQYLNDVVDAARSDKVGPHQLRAVVHAASALPIEHAVPLLARAAQSSSRAGIEAEIYATDKLVMKYLQDGCIARDLLDDPPYSTYFADATIEPWQQLGRLLGISMELGPDNTHPAEYREVLAALNAAVDRCVASERWRNGFEETFTPHFLAHCDRLMFNATPHGISRFFGNPHRPQLVPVLRKLADGGVLDEQDLATFEPYTQSLAVDVEYHLAHALFALSSLNDLEATLRLAERRYRSFSNQTSPVEIDFFHGVMVYLHIFHGLAYDQERFGWWEEIILQDWRDVLLHRPGLERGERRGFQDSFDRVFEDGFGVIYPYGVLMPSNARRTRRFSEYRRALQTDAGPQLAMYSTHLHRFLNENRLEEALQLLQALGSIIVVWPIEGLLVLRDVIGYSDPRVRRATVRILAEAYSRHPDETMWFLKSTGVAVSNEDLLTIKVRQDARIGRRQIETEEWARLAHFLSKRPGFRDAFVRAIDILLHAASIDGAVAQIGHSLGLGSETGR